MLSRNMLVESDLSCQQRRYRKDRDRIVATHDVIQQYENLRIMVQHKIHWFPNLTRLEYHLRPPSREIAPFPGGPTYQKNWVCDEALGDLVEILRKLTTRSVPKRVLEELSIQCLPVQQGFPLIENEDEMEETPAYLERILKKLRLRTLKLGLVSAEVWQPAGTRVSLNFSCCKLGYMYLYLHTFRKSKFSISTHLTCGFRAQPGP